MERRYFSPEDVSQIATLLLWQEFELSRLALGWMPAVPDNEMKMKLGRNGYLHTRHAKFLSERIAELSGKSFEKQGTPGLLREVYERLSLAPDVSCFLSSYSFLLQQQFRQYDDLLVNLDPVLDAPTVDQLQMILLHRLEMSDWVRTAVQFASADDREQRDRLIRWNNYIRDVWEIYQTGIRDDGTTPKAAWPEAVNLPPAGPIPDLARMDPRFPPFRHGDKQPAADPYADPEASPLVDSVKQMHYINATEMAAAENLAYLYYGVNRMPLDFYFDLARHLWDEVRHYAMGVRRLKQLGYSTEQFKYFRGGPGKPLDQDWYVRMYASLTMVAEPCSFIKKRKAKQAFLEFGDELSARHCEYDMVDERMHIDFGQKWGTELFQAVHDHLITARELSEKIRHQRLEALELPDEEIQKITKNFPAFCGFITTELKYAKY